MWLLTVAVTRRLCSAAVRIDVGVASLPDPSKKKGEDAHLVSQQRQVTIAGVFDGVGGWAQYGVDPSRYSNQLANLVELELTGQVESTGSFSLRDALRVAAKNNREIGSCTACVTAVDWGPEEEATVTTLNLGDSGAILLRPSPDADVYSLVARSQVQQHAFNTPYQLGTQSADSADDAELATFTGRAGDVVVLATDGLFDNMSVGEITDVLATELHEQPAKSMAVAIATIAQKLSFDAQRQSPFEIEAKKHGLFYKGGKVDDTTVIVMKLLP